MTMEHARDLGAVYPYKTLRGCRDPVAKIGILQIVNAEFESDKSWSTRAIEIRGQRAKSVGVGRCIWKIQLGGDRHLRLI